MDQSKKYLFQYCQKLVIFNNDLSQVLLVKRYGEADYDGTFSFVGGKMEISDKDFLAGLKREKAEEIGSDVVLAVMPSLTHNILFKKKDGNSMVLPHYAAILLSGTISLNSSEYSEYVWVNVEKIDEFEPKIETVPEAVHQLRPLLKQFSADKLVTI